MTGEKGAQLEHFDPGFREHNLARYTSESAGSALQIPDPRASAGGHTKSGYMDLRQLLTRPTPTSRPGLHARARYLYIYFSSTPPGGGVRRDGWIPRRSTYLA